MQDLDTEEGLKAAIKALRSDGAKGDPTQTAGHFEQSRHARPYSRFAVLGDRALPPSAWEGRSSGGRAGGLVGSLQDQDAGQAQSGGRSFGILLSSTSQQDRSSGLEGPLRANA